ncbi:MAG: hypothetical protein JW969_13215 [Spirochaetales bacterium]|nr:hypothetical protein [Spirochaetales bacterium]
MNLTVMGQVVSDPDDRLYHYLTIWYEKGYIDRLPVIRPCPLQVIIPMLKSVQEKGRRLDADIAGAYLKELNGDADKSEFKTEDILPRVHIGVYNNFMTDGDDFYNSTSVGFSGNGYVTDYFSYSGLLSMSLINPPNAGFFPLYSSYMDESKSGGGSLGSSFTIGQLSQFGIFFGNDFLYLQTGLMRTAFGPNYDYSPVVTPEAPAAGHISITLDAGWIGFSTLFLDLLASEYVDAVTGNMTYFDVSGDYPVLKYLVVQTIHLSLFDFLEVGVIQSILAGGVFHWYYIIPFPLQNLFYSQQMAGDRDSSFIGLYMRLRFPYGICFNSTFYIDDWDSFGAASQAQGVLINFDSAQNKFALQASLSWTPEVPLLKRIDLEYLMITPYTYTHSRFYKLNWLMYTNGGEKLGPNLEPNSDQIYLDIEFEPAAWLNIALSGRFIRHGNASEGFTSFDGSIYDDGFLDENTPTFVGAPSRFLTQSLLEYTLQTGIDTGFNLDFDWGSLTLDLGYLFEYVWNRDLVPGNDQMFSYFQVSAGYKW